MDNESKMHLKGTNKRTFIKLLKHYCESVNSSLYNWIGYNYSLYRIQLPEKFKTMGKKEELKTKSALSCSLRFVEYLLQQYFHYWQSSSISRYKSFKSFGNDLEIFNVVNIEK